MCLMRSRSKSRDPAVCVLCSLSFVLGGGYSDAFSLRHVNYFCTFCIFPLSFASFARWWSNDGPSHRHYLRSSLRGVPVVLPDLLAPEETNRGTTGDAHWRRCSDFPSLSRGARREGFNQQQATRASTARMGGVFHRCVCTLSFSCLWYGGLLVLLRCAEAKMSRPGGRRQMEIEIPSQSAEVWLIIYHKDHMTYTKMYIPQKTLPPRVDN